MRFVGFICVFLGVLILWSVFSDDDEQAGKASAAGEPAPIEKGDEVDEGAEQKKLLAVKLVQQQKELAEMLVTMTARHPHVVKLQAEIDEVKKLIATGGVLPPEESAAEKDLRLKKLKLLELLELFTDKHPDVVKLKSDIEAIEKKTQNSQ